MKRERRRERAEMRALKRQEELNKPLIPLVRVYLQITRGQWQIYLVPMDIVMTRYRDAELYFDIDNDRYCADVERPDTVPTWLLQFNKVS
jgi:hypothetical protein